MSLLVANQTNASVTLGNEINEATNCFELLWIKIDKHLDLNEHVSNLCKKGNHKLHACSNIQIFQKHLYNSNSIIVLLHGCSTIEH